MFVSGLSTETYPGSLANPCQGHEPGRGATEFMKGASKRIQPRLLTGERLYLRPFEKGDLVPLLKWMNDREILNLIGQVKPWSQRDAGEFLKRIRKEKDRAWFAVVLKGSHRVIGQAGLLRMFLPWNNTDLTMEINEKDVWDRGYGSEAINLLLSWAFDTLGFHRVSIGVVGFNTRALHFYAKNGFKREGVLREGYYCNREYSDFVMMAILEGDFRERTRAAGR